LFLFERGRGWLPESEELGYNTDGDPITMEE
jgi:hypothetical protein